ncbi:MAG TPA: hypothetical protein GXX18_14480 [Bacillales bacterium]|nr:hypothetical protein [Bacillales bacterium]
MAISFILLALVGTIALILFLALGTKRVFNADQEEREEMIKQIYQYAVAFITLIMVIGGGVFAFMSAADFVSPNPYYQSFEEYKDMKINNYKYEKEQTEKVEYTEEELQRQYDAMVEQQIEYAKQRAVNGLIKSFGWIIIPFPIYVVFQRRINQTRKNKE